MRSLFILLMVAFFVESKAQKAEHLIIITTDGFRWQEVFTGMDTSLANNKKYNEDDSNRIYKNYYSTNLKERRKKLMPFLWSTISEHGQIYGNRGNGNKVNVTNPYRISYPGYNEIFTGYGDTLINSNDFDANPNTTVLEFFQQQTSLKNKVAAFGAWDPFNQILNEKRAGFPVIAAFEKASKYNPTEKQILIDEMLLNSYKPWGYSECLDVFTHYAAMNYLKEKKPSVLYISYGETDEWAHAEKYSSYLNAAHQVDAWIKEIWEYIQQDPYYKDKTAIMITTDHGRGDDIKRQWASHGKTIKGADEIWFALIGAGIEKKGEVNNRMQLYQNQFAQTMAHLLGYTFTSNHPIGAVIPYSP
ncbi:MAG: alkaline phosphatase family protein [Sphingobacteriia bacterium]